MILVIFKKSITKLPSKYPIIIDNITINILASAVWFFLNTLLKLIPDKLNVDNITLNT